MYYCAYSKTDQYYCSTILFTIIKLNDPMHTLKTGKTAADKRILANITAANGTPTLVTDGHVLHNGNWLHVYVAFNDSASAAEILPHYWSEMSESWHAGDSINFESIATFALIEIRGEARVFFELVGIDAGDLDLWAGVTD